MVLTYKIDYEKKKLRRKIDRYALTMTRWVVVRNIYVNAFNPYFIWGLLHCADLNARYSEVIVFSLYCRS